METRVTVGPPSIGCGLMNLFSLAIAYAKMTDNMYISWQMALFPSTLFFGYSLIRVIVFLISSLRAKGHWRRFELRLTLLWKISQMIMLISAILFNTLLSNFLQEIDDADNPEKINHSITPLFIPIATILLTYVIYSYLHEKFSIQFTVQEDSHTDDKQVSVFRMITNSILSILGNSTAICAGGSCNNIYISTLSAFFSAFGIPIVEYIHYLSFIAFFFVGLSLFSLYSVRGTCLYPPFIVSVLGSICILTDLVFSVHDYFTYVGNVFVIAGAIWNAKLDKFSFAAAKKKKAALSAQHLPMSNHHHA